MFPIFVAATTVYQVHPGTNDAVFSQNGLLDVTLELDAMEFEDPRLSFMTVAFNGRIPGPTLHVYPGDTVHLTLKNNLNGPVGISGNSSAQFGNTIDCTDPGNDCITEYNPYQHGNTTNLHLHGLHMGSVQPGGEHCAS